MADDELKIFRDEDWKARIQREREEAAAKAAQQSLAPDSPAAAPNAPGEAELDAFPEPSFTGVVNIFAAQAMMGLGGMPGPNADEVFVDLDQARFFVEGLAVLRDKTQGNLTEGEAKHLDEVLQQLAQVYTAMVSELEAQSRGAAGTDPTKLHP